MSSESGPGSWLDKLMQTCWQLLLAAVALSVAVHLFLSVAGIVFIVIGVAGLATLVVALWRRHQGW